MKPIDIRLENWCDLLGRFTADRLEVHAWLQQFGASTCRELCAKTGRDINSVAPRVCELNQLGLVELVGKKKRCGIYKAVAPDEARFKFEEAKAKTMHEQQQEFPLRAAI
jgi:predicted transcriptional regulator